MDVYSRFNSMFIGIVITDQFQLINIWLRGKTIK